MLTIRAGIHLYINRSRARGIPNEKRALGGARDRCARRDLVHSEVVEKALTVLVAEKLVSTVTAACRGGF